MKPKDDGPLARNKAQDKEFHHNEDGPWPRGSAQNKENTRLAYSIVIHVINQVTQIHHFSYAPSTSDGLEGPSDSIYKGELEQTLDGRTHCSSPILCDQDECFAAKGGQNGKTASGVEDFHMEEVSQEADCVTTSPHNPSS